MNKEFWNERIETLKAFRHGWWNEDYFEFLVKSVWKIDRPVRVVDFGCGFGYMGILLMPLLPQGSTYTGIDIGDKLLCEAKLIFSDSEYNSNFIKADLTEYEAKSEYDIAICQAVLRHIPNSKNILKVMVDSVVADGMVVCMEADRDIDNAGSYYSGIDYAGMGKTKLLMKMWKNELQSGGRDYQVGIKIPQYMQELGLKDIQIRVNDRAKFVNPCLNSEENEKEYDSIVTSSGWNSDMGIEENQKYLNNLIDAGLTKAEAETFYNCEMKIKSHVIENKKDVFIVRVPCMLISFGKK